jgi:hypothetical protein
VALFYAAAIFRYPREFNMRVTRCALIALVLGLCLGGPLLAQARNPLFQAAGLPFNASDANGSLKRTRPVIVDFGKLSRGYADRVNARDPALDGGYRLTLNLFDDLSFDVVMDGVEFSKDRTTAVWVGHIPEMDLSSVFIGVTGSVAIGNIKTRDGAFYQLRYSGSGVLHYVHEVDESKFPPEAQPRVPNTPQFPITAPAAADPGTIIDLMTLYTPSARIAAGGTTAIQTLIQVAVAETNTGYLNSNIVQRINLVYRGEVAYAEADSDPFGSALDSITSGALNTTVLPLRNNYHADLVNLLIDRHDYCGLAWVMTTASLSFESRGYSIVDWSCATGYYTYAHEMGHNMGAQHDRANATASGAYSYSYGYQQQSASPPFRTVMAYNCPSGCTRLDYWSNPDVSTGISGTIFPTGIVDTSANAADNARTLNNTRAIVANFRTSQQPSLQFVPMTPCRVVDTRNTPGPLGGPSLVSAVGRTFPILAGSCGVPAAAVAYSMNVTVVPKAATLSYLTVWPTGIAQPLASTTNSADRSIVANAAIVPAGTAGSIDVYVTDATDLVLDINGYFRPPIAGSLQYYPVTPCRVLDTRNPAGPYGGPFIRAGAYRSFAITGQCGVPAGATAFSLNVTAAPLGALGFLTAWPTGAPQPTASTLNSLDGTTRANAAMVMGDAAGSVSFYASGDTDLVVDVDGYFAPPGAGLNFYTVTPCRLADTRNAAGPYGGPLIDAGTSRSFRLDGAGCGLPSTANAFSLNVTAVPAGPLGFLTAWPTGMAMPVVSTLNAPKGLPVANAAVVPAGPDGAVSIYVTNQSDLVLDTNGYFAP